MIRKILFAIIIILVGIWFINSKTMSALVKKEKDKIYIVDQRGEQWDVTQAASIGFKPQRFQYGIGRNAFTPLDDRHLSDNATSVSKETRVVGVVDGKSAQAYSIPRLRWHEIANSRIGSKPIAVGY